DRPDVFLPVDHLRRGAGRYQGVEAGHGAAHDADEHEGEDAAPGEGRAAVDELGVDRGAGQRRGGDEDADERKGDGADLEEARQVGGGAQQAPHRQHGGDEAVAAQGPDGLRLRQREEGREGRAWYPFADDDRGQGGGGADERRLDDGALADLVHVQSDEERDGDGAGDGEGAPGRTGHDLLALRRQDDGVALVGAELLPAARPPAPRPPPP